MFADVNGIRLYYESQGDGPPVVLVHGLGLSGDMWRYQVPALAQRYRVITLDTRGRGPTYVTNRIGQRSFGLGSGRPSQRRSQLDGAAWPDYLSGSIHRRRAGSVSAAAGGDLPALPSRR